MEKLQVTYPVADALDTVGLVTRRLGKRDVLEIDPTGHINYDGSTPGAVYEYLQEKADENLDRHHRLLIRKYGNKGILHVEEPADEGENEILDPLPSKRRGRCYQIRKPIHSQQIMKAEETEDVLPKAYAKESELQKRRENRKNKNAIVTAVTEDVSWLTSRMGYKSKDGSFYCVGARNDGTAVASSRMYSGRRR